MTFYDLAKKRYSVRKFRPDPVPEDIIQKILEAGMIAPTGCNSQPQRILVVRSSEGLEKIKASTRCHFDAPLVFVICYNREECWKRPYDGKLSGDIDATIVATHMMLAAEELGVGSCMVMHYRPEVLKEQFSLGGQLESTLLLVMGYPAADSAPAPAHDASRPMDELVSWC